MGRGVQGGSKERRRRRSFPPVSLTSSNEKKIIKNSYTPASGPASNSSAMIRVKTGPPPTPLALPVATDDKYSLTKGFTFSGEKRKRWWW